MSSPNNETNKGPNMVDKAADAVKENADKAKEKMGNEPPKPDHIGEAKGKLFEAKDAVVGAAGHMKEAATDAMSGGKKEETKPQASQ